MYLLTIHRPMNTKEFGLFF